MLCVRHGSRRLRVGARSDVSAARSVSVDRQRSPGADRSHRHLPGNGAVVDGTNEPAVVVHGVAAVHMWIGATENESATGDLLARRTGGRDLLEPRGVVWRRGHYPGDARSDRSRVEVASLHLTVGNLRRRDRVVREVDSIDLAVDNVGAIDGVVGDVGRLHLGTGPEVVGLDGVRAAEGDCAAASQDEKEAQRRDDVGIRQVRTKPFTHWNPPIDPDWGGGQARRLVRLDGTANPATTVIQRRLYKELKGECMTGCTRSDQPNGVHSVLLRHRLLAQPGGFEGLGGVEEVLHPDDPAVLKLMKHRHMHLDCRPARLSGRVLVEHGENAVIARVDQALQVDGPVEILRPCAHELDETITPSIDGPEADGGVWIWIRYPFGIGCDEFGVEDRAWIAPRQASLELVDRSPHNLHVLLRHRLRSISRQEPAEAGPRRVRKRAHPEGVWRLVRAAPSVPCAGLFPGSE